LQLAELLFWPALLAYGEAAVAYLGEARRPGVAGQLATWGVRIGWLVQTALLAVQAARSDGFPWSTWAGSLNLFVWLVVGAYLIWGCRPRYRLLGLAVLPLIVVLFVVARVGGGTGIGGHSHYSNLFLVLHVGLVLAAFAGFTLAAALSALYLWQERRLKRRETSILSRRAPALAKLDDVAARTIATALPALTLGIAVGIVRLEDRGGDLDALMAVTVLTWGVYAAYLALRWFAGLRGRRAAYVILAGFVLVVVVRLALPVTHFAT
jgi:ABC-type transport system involved in cytochrome c biogenesis permease subunit